MRSAGRSIAGWIALAAVVIALDQWTKHLVLGHIKAGEQIVLAPFVSLVLAFNTGAAFSFLAGAGGWQRFLFAAIAAGASIFIVVLLRRHRDERLFSLGLALILGGAIGNLIDRVQMEAVVDFILVHDWLPGRPEFLGWLDPFPAFNVADSAITGGAIALILDSFRPRRAAGLPRGAPPDGR